MFSQRNQHKIEAMFLTDFNKNEEENIFFHNMMDSMLKVSQDVSLLSEKLVLLSNTSSSEKN